MVIRSAAPNRERRSESLFRTSRRIRFQKKLVHCVQATTMLKRFSRRKRASGGGKAIRSAAPNRERRSESLFDELGFRKSR